MAGTCIDIEIQDEAVVTLLKRLVARVADPQPALAEIGEYGMQSTRDRITSQNADDPIAAWAPLSESYLQSELKQGSRGADMIMVLHGHLAGTLAWQSGGSTVQWGSNRAYAAAQQFGRPEINLPARPWLGLTTRDIDAVTDILHRWLSVADAS